MRIKTVEEQLVELSVTEEERKRHADLIQECLEREKRLNSYRVKIQERMEAVTANLQTISHTMEIIDLGLRELSGRLAEITLRLSPVSKLPRA
jgi:multidrug resistance efflux pump